MMGVNSLSKTVTRQHRGCDLNPGPSAPESSMLTTQLPSVLGSGAEGPGLKSQSRRCRVTVLGKLFTPIVPLFTKQQKLVAAVLRVAGVTAGVAEGNGSLPPGL